MELDAINATLLEFLRQYVPHPRVGYTGDWIFLSYPQVPINSPTIVLQATGARPFRLGIGSSDLGYTYTYELLMYTDQTTIYTINGESYSGSKLLAWLVNKVFTAFQEHQDWLKAGGIEEAVVESIGRVGFTVERGLFTQSISLSVMVL